MKYFYWHVFSCYHKISFAVSVIIEPLCIGYHACCFKCWRYLFCYICKYSLAIVLQYVSFAWISILKRLYSYANKQILVAITIIVCCGYTTTAFKNIGWQYLW